MIRTETLRFLEIAKFLVCAALVPALGMEQRPPSSILLSYGDREEAGGSSPQQPRPASYKPSRHLQSGHFHLLPRRPNGSSPPRRSGSDQLTSQRSYHVPTSKTQAASFRTKVSSIACSRSELSAELTKQKRRTNIISPHSQQFSSLFSTMRCALRISTPFSPLVIAGSSPSDEMTTHHASEPQAVLDSRTDRQATDITTR